MKRMKIKKEYRFSLTGVISGLAYAFTDASGSFLGNFQLFNANLDIAALLVAGAVAFIVDEKVLE